MTCNVLVCVLCIGLGSAELSTTGRTGQRH